MNILILGDVHSNLAALQALREDLEMADRVVCLGDLTGYYCQPNEVIEFLRLFDPICVLGNHDHLVLNGCPHGAPPAVRFGIDYARQVLTPEHRAWVAGQPLLWAGLLGGRKCMFVHGSPWRPLDDYLYSDNPALKRLDDFDYDLMAFGQTHRRYSRSEKKPILLNPGSVGQARDASRLARAAWIDSESMGIRWIDRPYDPSPVIALARHHGAEDWIEKHLIETYRPQTK